MSLYINILSQLDRKYIAKTLYSSHLNHVEGIVDVPEVFCKVGEEGGPLKNSKKRKKN